MGKLRKAGLFIMLLPFVFLIIFSLTHGLNEYYDLATNLGVSLIQGVPCLLVTATSWLWPRRGGTVAVVLSLLLLTLSASMIMMSKAPAPGQEFPTLSFTEISTHILPYTILLFGSILAFASARKANSPDLLPRVSTGNARVDKLRRTGLLMMFLFGVGCILLFIIAIGIGGDMVLAGNLFVGLTLGLTFATLPLLLAAAAWRWPFRGGAVAIGLSLALLLLLIIIWVMDPVRPIPWVWPLIVSLPIIVLLIGSILVFISAKRAAS